MFHEYRDLERLSRQGPSRACSSLVDVARRHARQKPEHKAFVFLRDGEVETEWMSYAALDLGARAMAATLLQHLKPGDRVLLSYPAGLEFIVAFFGCLYSGIVAVPTYPPTSSLEVGALERIAQSCGAKGVCVARSGFGGTRVAIAGSSMLRSLACITLPDSADTAAQAWFPPDLQSDTLALLQYTSGSTGAPKGVMVSHGNLLHNQRLIKAAFGHTEQTVGVCWLPLYHDMGLIGHVLQSLYLGITTVLMSPVAFVAKPARWLRAISNYKATSSGGPDFAFDLCLRRVTAEQMVGLDLSSWKVAFSGAETIRDLTLARFAEKFSVCGFRRNALTSCYGMAEATLLVTASVKTRAPIVRRVDAAALQRHLVRPVEAGDGKDIAIVSCGRPVEQEVAIVDPHTHRRCRSEQVGEIWVRGPSVARGYWNSGRESAATFEARIADSGDGPFLRTGDLGFLDNGELFVTGRVKDLIVIDGRNYYPSCIEAAVGASHPALEGGAAAAFSVEHEGQERLVVVHEVHRHVLQRLPRAEVMSAASHALMRQLGVPLQDLVLLHQGSLPKTSSGKIRRNDSRRAYLDKVLN